MQGERLQLTQVQELLGAISSQQSAPTPRATSGAGLLLIAYRPDACPHHRRRQDPLRHQRARPRAQA